MWIPGDASSDAVPSAGLPSGRSRLILPEVDAEIFSLAVKHFAEAVGAEPRKRIVLVLDRAGWNASNDLVVPEEIHLVFLPACSPELQPAEHLWPLVHEAIGLRKRRVDSTTCTLGCTRIRATTRDRERKRRLMLFDAPDPFSRAECGAPSVDAVFEEN